jgi:ribonuclease HI
VADVFPDRFLYLHLDAPKKNGEGFREWMDELKTWIATEEADGQWMIYTDSAYWDEKRHGTAAAVITRGGLVVTWDADWCPATSSWDSELTALLLTLEWVSQHLDIIDKDSICFLIDNKSVIQSFLSMDTRSSQMMALRINLILADILSRNSHLRISLSHCLSHSGIHFNEEADRMVNVFVIHENAHQVTLRQHFIDRGIQLADNDWRNSSMLSKYRGRSWMKIRQKKKPFVPHIRNKEA